MFSNRMRMTGFSGIDVADMVNQMMRVESMRLDRLRQNRDIMVWQQQQMRDVTASVRQFQNRFLTISTATGADSIRQPANFAALRANVTSANGNANAVTINPQSNAQAGNHTLNVTSTAQAHGIRSNTSHNQGAVASETLDLRAFVNFGAATGDLDNFVTGGNFRINVNGTIRNINIDAATLRSTFGDGALQSVQDLHNTHVTQLAAMDADIVSGTSTAADRVALLETQATEMRNLFDAASNIAINSDFDYYALESHVRGQLAAFGESPNGTGTNVPRAEVSFENGNLVFTAASGNTLSVLGGTGAGAINTQQLGFAQEGSTTAALSVNTSLASFLGIDTVDATNRNVQFNINGTTFEFDLYTEHADITIQGVMNAVNNANAGVRMSFSAATGLFSLESTQTGTGARITTLEDTEGSFLYTVFNAAQGGTFVGANLNDDNLANVDVFRVASSAEFTLNGTQMSRETNSFTVDGLNINLTPGAIGEFNIDVQRDAGEVRQLVNNFINAYNDIVRSIMELTETRRPRQNGGFFMPLTQEQRQGMSESEIRDWEEQAMTGVLNRNDPLRNFMNEMRSALTMNVPMGDGFINLAHIGIRSVQDIGGGGMIEIRDEELFESFLSNNPEAIANLFGRVELRSEHSSDRSWFEASGLGDRLNDIMNRALSNRTGSLASFAGIPLNTTENNNILTNRINEQDQRISRMMDWLERRENQLFAQFGRMETAMMQAQSQMMFFEQMFWM